MMLLIFMGNPLQDCFGLLHCGFFHSNRLKSSFQGCIFFYIFTILGNRCGSNQLYLTSCKRWFQNIGSINSTFGSAGSDDGMKFIQKQDYIAVLDNFLHNSFYSLFKFAAIFASGNHTGQIQCKKSLVLYGIGHVSSNDTGSESFHHSCFSYARLAHKTRIVLGSSG